MELSRGIITCISQNHFSGTLIILKCMCWGKNDLDHFRKKTSGLVGKARSAYRCPAFSTAFLRTFSEVHQCKCFVTTHVNASCGAPSECPDHMFSQIPNVKPALHIFCQTGDRE